MKENEILKIYGTDYKEMTKLLLTEAELESHKVAGGLHGVGASVVNALSEWTEVTVKRDGGIYTMKFERGKTVEPIKKIGETKETGTKVRFLADNTIFETTEYNFNTLETRFREVAFLTKGLKINIEDQRGEEPKKSEFCFEPPFLCKNVKILSYLNPVIDRLWLLR